MVAAGDLDAGGGDVARGLLHLAHQAAQRLLHAAHGLHELAHLVPVVHLHIVRKVAAGNAFGQRARLRQ